MVSTGICHTDLGCGTLPDGASGFPVPPYPRVLGHEGAGIVMSVGTNVTKVKAGDHVLLSFAFCKRCHNCQFGAPGYCQTFSEINFTGNKEAFIGSSREGQFSIGGSFFGQSSFSKLARVQQTSLVNVSNLIRNREELRLLAPLGCGIQTAAGTVTDLAKAGPDDKIAIIGLGGVGIAAIMAAKLRGCRTIIGIDRVSSRLEKAASLGATLLVNTTTVSGTLATEVHRLTSGTGTTITVDTTGVVSLIKEGVEFTANQGKIILLGVAPSGSILDLPIVPYMLSGKQLMGSMEGGIRPEEYIPQMVHWYQSGRFPVDQVMTLYPAKDFQRAIKDMEEGVTIKPVIVW